MRPWTLVLIGVALVAAGVRAALAPFPGLGGNPALDLIAYRDPGLHTVIHVWYYSESERPSWLVIPDRTLRSTSTKQATARIIKR